MQGCSRLELIEDQLNLYFKRHPVEDATKCKIVFFNDIIIELL